MCWGNSNCVRPIRVVGCFWRERDLEAEYGDTVRVRHRAKGEQAAYVDHVYLDIDYAHEAGETEVYDAFDDFLEIADCNLLDFDGAFYGDLGFSLLDAARRAWTS